MIIKILKTLQFVLKNRSELTFKKVKKNKIVIFDKIGSEHLLPLFNKDQVTILETRFEKIYLIYLIKCILNMKFELANYFSMIIEEINPKIVITLIDNKPQFYQLKNIISNNEVKFISIQNGTRRKIGDIFGVIENYKNLSSDFYFVWGDIITKNLSKYISSNFIQIGSFKNNNYEISSSNKKLNEINFISQFRKYDFYKNYGDDYFIEKKLIPLLYDFCLLKNLTLNILCASNHEEEKIFYKNLLKSHDVLIFSNKENPESNYKKLDEGLINVFIDSTLGYESFARKNRTLACSLRLQKIDENTMRFGWPEHVKYENEIFNLKELSKEHIFKKIDYLLNLSDEDWTKANMKIDDIILYDEHNSRLKELINRFV